MKILNRLLFLTLFVPFVTTSCSGGGGGGTPPSNLSDTVPFNISAGHGSAAMINQIGVLRTWGDNQDYQLGDVSGDDQDMAITIPPPDTETIWHTVSVGGYHMIAIARKDTERSLWGWGFNLDGEAGYMYTDDNVKQPHRIGLDTDWAFISAGLYHNMAIKTDGTLWAWGHNQYSQLGYPAVYSYTPTRVGTEAGWSFASAGHYHTLALKDTTLYAWGRNTWGQCGNGESMNNLSAPTYISTGWKQVSAGYTESAGVKLDGTLWAWGGDGLTTILGNDDPMHEGSTTPVQVGTDRDWEMVSVGGTAAHKLAIKKDGTLWAWGPCGGGALGNGCSSGFVMTPVEIQPGTVWTSVSAGDSFAVGTMKEHTPYAWGDNGYGQLGTGGHDDSNVPVPVVIP